MSEIIERIKEFGDEFLLEQYNQRKDDYTEEALTLMKEEITLRNLENNIHVKNSEESTEENDSGNEQEELIPLENKFSRTDLILAQSILTEEKIPFFVTSSTQSSALPIEAEAINSYSISVPKSQMEKTKESLNKHFHSTGGLFSAKFLTIKERLKSFCFYDISLSADELEEEVDVQFSSEESMKIELYINKLYKEAEILELKSEKVLFYIDNLQECLNHLKDPNCSTFTKTDLLTILEALQVYCDEEDFPPLLENTAEVLLNFFTT